MFESWKEKLGIKKKGEVLTSPIVGNVVALSKVNDPTFSQEMLGKGVAIVPSEGRVFSPVNGKVEMVFDTKHAISLSSDTGIQILIHVGIDTVSLKGDPFRNHVETGQKVKKGDLLLEFDIETIKKAGLDTITPIVICNSDQYKEILTYVNREVRITDKIITLTI